RARHGAAMSSPSNTWEGMSEVGSLFYGKFLTQVREVAGPEKAKELIKQHIKESEHHEWLNNPDKANPILGYGKGSSNEN
ncbi:MAG: hypothetical protein GQ546_00075, partial [Gammaproteobacteria bacterium]|nr:hypothetical protein [Gammaproteobacteria bacterium]